MLPVKNDSLKWGMRDVSDEVPEQESRFVSPNYSFLFLLRNFTSSTSRFTFKCFCLAEYYLKDTS